MHKENILPYLLILLIALSTGLLGYVVLVQKSQITQINSKVAIITQSLEENTGSQKTTGNAQPNVDQENHPTAQEKQADDTKNNDTYTITDGALVKNGKQIMIKDVKTAGLVPVFCSFDDISEYAVIEQKILFIEGCGEMGGTLWSYDTTTNTITKNKVSFQFGAEDPALNNRFQVILGPLEKDGEVRTLLSKDFFRDTETVVGQIPQSLTYRAGDSEFDGSPYGSLQWYDGTLYADVFMASVPVNGLDSREPVLKKYISF